MAEDIIFFRKSDMSDIFSYLKQLVCKFAGIVSSLGTIKGFACFITSKILPDDLVMPYISGSVAAYLCINDRRNKNKVSCIHLLIKFVLVDDGGFIKTYFTMQ